MYIIYSDEFFNKINNGGGPPVINEINVVESDVVETRLHLHPTVHQHLHELLLAVHQGVAAKADDQAFPQTLHLLLHGGVDQGVTVPVVPVRPHRQCQLPQQVDHRQREVGIRG